MLLEAVCDESIFHHLNQDAQTAAMPIHPSGSVAAVMIF
jgi:hypothetical protein